MKLLKEEAYKEATKIKQFITKEELDKINFENLNPHSCKNCLYGQISGSAFGKRSAVIRKICAKYSEHLPFNPGCSGVIKEGDIHSYERGFFRFSLLENYLIRISKEEIKDLVNFIKG